MTPPPTALLCIVASAAGVAHGCAGLRLVDNQTGEVKRVYVKTQAATQQTRHPAHGRN